MVSFDTELVADDVDKTALTLIKLLFTHQFVSEQY